jgi:Na+-driven multidrug efflux pump
VAGVGIATILSQLLSVILVAAKMMHTHDVYRLVLSELRIDRTLLRQVMALGLPAAVLNSFVSTSNLFVQRYLNGFGSAAMAGVGAGNKIERFMLMALQSLGLTVGTFVSQNVGAGKYRRAFSGIRVCMVITMAILVVSGIPGWIFARQLAEIFTDDPAAIEYGVLTIRTMFPFLIFQLFNQVLPNAVRGFGRSIAVTTLGMVGMIGCRQIYLAIAMHFAPSVKTVVFGYPVGWFFAATLLAIYYLLVIRIPYGKLAKEERAESDA